jgi:putative tricarboxylic transport membrane protein
MNKPQASTGVGVLVAGLLLAAGAWDIPKEAGYGGVGANFLPLVVAGALLLCGGWLVWESANGGFREMDEPSGAASGDWRGFAWVSAGILVNGLLISRIGFILSCTLCFMLAVRGFKASQGSTDRSLRGWAVNAGTGFAIAAPVYWMFTKLLNISLPGLTSTGWL